MVTKKGYGHPGEQRLLIRVTDPEDRLVYWGYQESANGNTPPIELLDPVVTPARGRICLGAVGTYQVRVYGNQNVDVTAAVSAGTPYGVLFPYLNYRNWEGQPSEMFFWAPVHRAIPLKLSLAGSEGGSGITIANLTRIRIRLCPMW